MNGPIKMFRTRQIVRHDFPVDLPNCMFKLNNFHSARSSTIIETVDHVSSSTASNNLDIYDQNNQETPQIMAELEARQEKILQQLAELKDQIFAIRNELNVSKNETTHCRPVKVCEKTSQKVNVDNLPEEIVVNANPNNPPYSLVIVQKLLESSVKFSIVSHVHSSVNTMPENAVKLQKTLADFDYKTTGLPVVNLKLIWKNIESNTELLISYTPLFGEVNLLRYLTRLINFPSLSYQTDESSVEIDSLLDQCYLLVRASTKTERTSILQLFSKSLGKAEYLLGRKQFTIADIAGYSAVKQCMNSGNEISANLNKWYQRCEALVS